MAPEILQNIHAAGKPKTATLDDLKLMDVWSFAMVCFVILSPDLHVPYDLEFHAGVQLSKDATPYEIYLVKLRSQGLLPQKSGKL